MGRGVPIVLVFVLLAGTARAAETPDGYEAERTQKVLDELGLTVDPAPEGKRIGAIRVVGHDVFVEDEVWPTFLNVFHWKTDEDVVRRELLFAPGEPWQQARVDESARKLRDQFIFALVRIVPIDIGSADTVDVLVFTRDLWSLRLEWSFGLTDGFVDELSLTLIERNLLGRNVQAAVDFSLLPKTFSFGERFIDRRVFGSRWKVEESFALIFSRDSGELEGTRGGISLGIPLWNLQPRWGFDVSASWDDAISRQLSGRDVLTYDAPGSPEDDAVPRIWDHQVVKLSVTGMRQLGDDEVLHRLGFGYAILTASYTPHHDTALVPGSPLYEAFREDVLPQSRDQLYPFINWIVLTPRWVTFKDLAAFGLSEDVRTGPTLDLAFAAPLKAFGSDTDALIWEASLGFVLAPEICDDHALIDLLTSLRVRLQGGEAIDQTYRVRLRTATHRFLLGRVVFSVDLESRVADSSSTLIAIGGDNGLRGYPSQAFYGFGVDRLRTNLELRSPPVVLGSVHIGGVLFYDVGGVGEGPARLDLHHALGLGLRMLLPQLNRFTLRFDLGFPLDSDHPTMRFMIGTTQAVPLTTLEDEKLSQ